MSDWKAQMKDDTTSWLLEEDNPSVRYLALRHLLERPEDDPEVKATRAAIPRSRVVERIFARQDPGGFWGDPTNPYLPKYKASYWTLMMLGHLGLSREDERVQRAVEHIFRFQQSEGACPSTIPSTSLRARLGAGPELVLSTSRAESRGEVEGHGRGGFAEFGEEGARREYLYKAEKARGRGKEPPEESAFLADLVLR